jgi:hypothetical protein
MFFSDYFVGIWMIRDVVNVIAAATVLMLTGCVTPTTALAPGAAAVRIARSEADVASCTPVGNVVQPPNQRVDMRNLTVGVGGDTLFVTEGLSSGYIAAGVAYRCSK